MRTLLTILFCFVGLTLNAAIYYVAVDGNDSNPGTIGQPWKTWGKAFNDPIIDPGDTIYFRGGIYYRDYTTERAANPSWFSAAGHAYWFSNAGEEGNRIYYLNYPGETPILDDTYVTGTATLHIMINGVADHCYFRGLTFQNCYVSSSTAQAVIWRYMGSNLTLENCVARNTHGIGFQVWGSRTNVRFINCDAYNHCDSLDAETPGNRGTGFAIVNTSTATGDVYYENCRAWNCGDQGYSSFSNGYMEYNGCWSFLNGQMLGGGHGFKIGFSPSAGTDAALLRKVYNCVATYNRANGFTTNDNGYRAITCQIYNNIAYRNFDFSNDYGASSTGFVIYNTTSNDATELGRIFRNNISYANETANISVSSGALYTHSNNTWDGGVTVNDLDFISLDTTGITAARQADGSLPDNDCYNKFLRLASTSDLIGGGIDVGLTYDGQDSLWLDPPSLGPYEYYTPEEGEEVEPLVIFTTGVYPAKTSATVNGNVYDDGGGTISARGVCWGTDADPDLTDNVVIVSGTTGLYIATITGLTSGETYHVRAYATNEAGTRYGADLEFTTTTTSFVKSGTKYLFINGKWLRL